MEVYGYVEIAHDSYDTWKSNTLGKKYDVDGIPIEQPFQCWDYTAEFWYNVGFPQNYPLTGNGKAEGCWRLERDNNISYDGTQYFDLIEDITQIKRGDVVVFDSSIGGGTGHIGFADEDYSGLILNVLGENETLADPSVQVVAYPSNKIQGAFRYRGWQQTPPPTPTFRRSKFKWVLYARKIRERNIV